MMKTSV